VKFFNFVDTTFGDLTTLDMFEDTWIREFQIICNITKGNKFFRRDHKFVDCPTHEIKCPMNINAFTVVQNYCNYLISYNKLQ